MELQESELYELVHVAAPTVQSPFVCLKQAIPFAIEYGNLEYTDCCFAWAELDEDWEPRWLDRPDVLEHWGIEDAEPLEFWYVWGITDPLQIALIPGQPFLMWVSRPIWTQGCGEYWMEWDCEFDREIVYREPRSPLEVVDAIEEWIARTE